jgi:hypothetical protein
MPLVQLYKFPRLILASFMLVLAFGNSQQLHRLGLVRTRVYNISDRSAFERPDLPGFVRQGSNTPALIQFQKHTRPVVAGATDELSKVIALLHWVRSQESDEQFYGQGGATVDDTEDPEKYLEEQKKGLRSACRRFAYILTGALVAEGMNARVVGLKEGFTIPRSASHNVVEVWITKLHRWIVVDPTFDSFILVNGSTASVLEVQSAARSNGKITFDQHGSKYRLPRMDQYRRYYNHVFVAMTNALFDGYRYGLLTRKPIYFAHYAGPGIEPYPIWRKRRALIGLAVSLTVLSYLGMELFIIFVSFTVTSHR